MAPMRPLISTYSIVARDPVTGEIGVAVESHYLATGAVVTWAEAGVGAVATQSSAEISYGPDGLDLMRAGRSAPEALEELLKRDPDSDRRQVAMVDANGVAAAHTGARCIKAAGHLVSPGFSVQANLMANDTVWPAMKQAYENSGGDLTDRLLAALDAAQASGGDIRGQQSATILVVGPERQQQTAHGRIFDLRVDDHPQPLRELRRLVRAQRAYNLLNTAEDALLSGDPAAARETIMRSLEMAPEMEELYAWAGITLTQIGEVDEGLRLYGIAAAKEPGWRLVIDALVEAAIIPDNPEVNARLKSG